MGKIDFKKKFFVFRKYLSDPDFHYVDFAQRERKNEFPTFRVQVEINRDQSKEKEIEK